MKNYALFSLTTAFLLAGNISFAQNSILAGKIVNENNKPIPGATICVSKQGEMVQEIRADGDGLFAGKPMGAGDYSLSVTAKGHNLKLNYYFILDPKAGSEKYYIIKVANGKLVIDMVNDDPAIKVRLAKIEKSKENADGEHFYITRTITDSATGKTQTTTQGPDGKPPRMK